MTHDNRQTQTALPANIETLLTEGQRRSLRRVENFGWHLKFVRQLRCEPPMVVVENASGQTIGILEESGRLQFEPDIPLRA